MSNPNNQDLMIFRNFPLKKSEHPVREADRDLLLQLVHLCQRLSLRRIPSERNIRTGPLLKQVRRPLRLCWRELVRQANWDLLQEIRSLKNNNPNCKYPIIKISKMYRLLHNRDQPIPCRGSNSLRNKHVNRLRHSGRHLEPGMETRSQAEKFLEELELEYNQTLS